MCECNYIRMGSTQAGKHDAHMRTVCARVCVCVGGNNVRLLEEPRVLQQRGDVALQRVLVDALPYPRTCPGVVRLCVFQRLDVCDELLAGQVACDL